MVRLAAAQSYHPTGHGEPNRQTFWFGAELAPDGSQVWFRITSEAVRRMREQTPGARGDPLVDAFLAWLMTPDRQMEPGLNRAWSSAPCPPGDIAAYVATERRSEGPARRGRSPAVDAAIAADVDGVLEIRPAR